MSQKTTEHNVALYTKYRPQKFAEVLGQEHITETLKESIKTGKIAHAYLFTGSRGTGKTSIARIFAREIGTTDRDLYEIDAASNNGVEEIRALKESINLLPFDSKYKVYIFDEVHMLSKSAFNALLKTLEEPPAYAIFILATTEAHKIPETVLSRCETYNFKTPNRAVLKKMIVDTAKKEGFVLEGAVAELVAVLGDGSFRDAHTILQKLLRVSADKKITLAEAEKVTGSPKNVLINDILEAMLSGDLERGLSAVKIATDENLDHKVLYKLLLEKYRNLLLIKVAPTKKSLYDESASEDDIVWFNELVAKYGEKIDSLKLVKLLGVGVEMSRSYLPFLPLELLLIDVVGKR